LECSRELYAIGEYMEKVLQVWRTDRDSNPPLRPDENLFKHHVVFVPTQVFLDASGKEVFRLTGGLTQYELVKKLKELT
jgi:hypothetical protein